MNKKPTQAQRVLRYLKRHVGITDAEARDELGISRLSGRIYELRESGVNIANVWREGTNRYGEQTRFVEYRLVK